MSFGKFRGLFFLYNSLGTSWEVFEIILKTLIAPSKRASELYIRAFRVNIVNIFSIILVLLKSSKNSGKARNSPSCVFLRLLPEKLWKTCPKIHSRRIPVNVLKDSEFCFSDLTNCINEAVRNKFPDSLNLSDITPVSKNVDHSDKASYKSTRVLSLFSKVFEKIIYDQLYR